MVRFNTSSQVVLVPNNLDLADYRRCLAHLGQGLSRLCGGGSENPLGVGGLRGLPFSISSCNREEEEEGAARRDRACLPSCSSLTAGTNPSWVVLTLAETPRRWLVVLTLACRQTVGGQNFRR